MSSSKPLVTPEEVVVAAQLSCAELFNGAGATMQKVAEMTAAQLEATTHVKAAKKAVPDWTQRNIAAERIMRANGAYAAEKQTNVIQGNITIGWETDQDT